jgi:protein-tyrosine phosphatase
MPGIFSAVRHGVERLLHPWRYRSAVSLLRAARRPGHILVVCNGNLCRSPYLEALLRRALPDVVVSSAGMTGPGRPVPEVGRDIAARRGLDLTQHRSRLLTRDMLATADLVVVMDRLMARYLGVSLRVPRDRIVIAGDLDRFGGSRTIRDPWRQTQIVFESSYARLDRAAETLVASLPPPRRGV